MYDEYISDYKDHRAVVDAHIASQLNALGNALRNILVVDGQIAGVWKRSFSKKQVVIEVQPFRPLEEVEEQAVAKAAQRFGDFLGLEMVLVEITIHL